MINKQQVIDYYLKNHTLRQCAKRFGVSMQRIHQIIRDLRPEIMRRPYDKFSRQRD
jgi:transposase